MSEYEHKAVERLRAELKAIKGDKYVEVMKGSVEQALEGMCRQNDEFAQAVADGGSFGDAMKAVRAAVKGGALSDADAYAAAARFYFRGAQVKWWIEIRLEGDAEMPQEEPQEKPQEKPQEEPKKETAKGLLIDLTEFL